MGVAVAINAALPESRRFWQPTAPLLSAVITVLVLPFIAWVLREIVGDAAVYLDDAPTNIQRRHEIRTAGVHLLDVLHQRGYDRIIVVGHSLGSVIGYDILKYAWASVHDRLDPNVTPHYEALVALENATREIAAQTPEGFADQQRAYLRELHNCGHPWRVSDFVTLGSPLTYAPLLLAGSEKDLRRQISDRELPTCPPGLERSTVHGQMQERFSFQTSKRDASNRSVDLQVPHHAAVFAPVAWTNLYFPNRFVLFGDIIGGPLAAWFGAAVRDVSVKTGIRGGLFAHIDYWTPSKQQADTHIAALRDALALGRKLA